ncbi:hypothetical protein AB0M28_30780 [Streptomyces sp. NPDC051940]|uniref:hypothetical protein n=1 Tax=Streptomyces sp. NPDC051940 TaxID=3155675 RepID=UPI00342521C4
MFGHEHEYHTRSAQLRREAADYRLAREAKAARKAARRHSGADARTQWVKAA